MNLTPPSRPSSAPHARTDAGGVTAAGAGIAGAVVLVAAAGLVLFTNGVPEVCHEEVAPVGVAAAAPDELVVQVCGPMTVADPRVLVFLLVLLLLLLPWSSGRRRSSSPR